MQPPEDEDDSWVNLCLFCIVWSGLVKSSFHANPLVQENFQIHLDPDPTIKNLCKYLVKWEISEKRFQPRISLQLCLNSNEESKYCKTETR